MNFQKYRRTNIAEMRPVTAEEVADRTILSKVRVSISGEDLLNGSPLPGDMIARNPDNHKDMWLVAKVYFETNFEQIKESK